MNKLKVAIYARSFLFEKYVDAFSRFESLDVTWIGDSSDLDAENIYDFLKKYGEGSVDGVDISCLEKDNIFDRCRLLRSMRREDAEVLVKRMQLAINDVLDIDQFDVIISPAVDNYITHMIFLLSKKRKIRHVGISSGYFPGYLLMTTGRTGLKKRSVSEAEVLEVRKKIEVENYRRDYGQISEYSISIHLLRVIRHSLKVLVFNWYRLKYNNTDNYHWNVVKYIGEQKRIFNYVSEDQTCFTKKEELNNIRDGIYLPLSFTPEMSTEYWVDNIVAIEYEEMIIRICKELSNYYPVLVKDHFHMLGIREKEFYKELSQLDNVYVLPNHINSNFILNYVERILVGTGSSGIEGVVRNKKIYTYSENSYWYNKKYVSYLDLNDINKWSMIIDGGYPEINGDKKNQFVKYCLEYCIPGSLNLKDNGFVSEEVLEFIQ